MNIDLPAGRYVVAVSGGVDSVVLLRSLLELKHVQLIVAHYDHGIRQDSSEDRRLVQALAKEYGLQFVYHNGHLGASVGEAAARESRYAFLHTVRKASRAQAVITAHHQDDLLETVILNLLRGTGRRGLSSLKSTDVIKRPLLHTTKKELLRYADREGLRWREDSTNADMKYLRNYVRLNVLPRFDETSREALVGIVNATAGLNVQITDQVVNYLHMQPGVRLLDRYEFIMLPHTVAREVMAEWLLTNTKVELSKKLLERLVVAAKVAKAGTKVDIDAEYWLHISSTQLALQARER